MHSSSNHLIIIFYRAPLFLQFCKDFDFDIFPNVFYVISVSQLIECKLVYILFEILRSSGRPPQHFCHGSRGEKSQLVMFYFHILIFMCIAILSLSVNISIELWIFCFVKWLKFSCIPNTIWLNAVLFRKDHSLALTIKLSSCC